MNDKKIKTLVYEVPQLRRNSSPELRRVKAGCVNGSLPGSYAFVNNDTCFTGNSPGYKIQQCFNGITNESATFSMNCVDGNDPDSPGCSVGNSYYPVSSPGCNPGGDKFPDACATGSIN